jgi:hypothetical protein
VRLQQQHKQPDSLLLGLCASIGVRVAEPITERIGERATESLLFAIVKQSAATTPVNVSSSTTDFGFRRVVYGHRERLLRPR